MLSSIHMSISKSKYNDSELNSNLNTNNLFLNGTIDENLKKNYNLIVEKLPLDSFPELQEYFNELDLTANNEKELFAKLGIPEKEMLDEFGTDETGKLSYYHITTDISIKKGGAIYLVLIIIVQDIQIHADENENN